jgi:hypothetical protein
VPCSVILVHVECCGVVHAVPCMPSCGAYSGVVLCSGAVQCGVMHTVVCGAYSAMV